MLGGLFEGFSLIDLRGYIILAAIFALLCSGITTTLYVRGRYALLSRELRRRGEGAQAGAFDSKVLTRIARETLETLKRHSGEVNTQAIIEQAFQTELKLLLVGERFVKATTGLLIILGLVGTFYGLTLSIGKLVTLVSGDASSALEVTTSLMRGLTEALSGMSVAFSSSLFGILAAIVMTLLGVFANVPDRRNAVMVQIEAYLDNVLVRGARQPLTDARGAPDVAQLVAGFGESVAQLQSTIARFESALGAFATSTRDFKEFNHHLKDNIQRMSLSFGDLSQTLKDQVGTLRSSGRG